MLSSKLLITPNYIADQQHLTKTQWSSAGKHYPGSVLYITLRHSTHDTTVKEAKQNIRWCLTNFCKLYTIVRQRNEAFSDYIIKQISNLNVMQVLRSEALISISKLSILETYYLFLGKVWFSFTWIWLSPEKSHNGVRVNLLQKVS